MAKKLDDLRDKVMKSDFAPIPNIYNKFKSQFCATESDLVRNIPSFANIKSKLYYARNNAAGVKKIKCKSIDEVEVPLQFRDFLFYDYKDESSNTRIIILVRPNQLEKIPSIKFFESDGTFDCTPEPFVQLYTIHGDLGSDEDHTRIVPLIYVLLNKKTEETYKKLFEILKQNIPGWEPVKFLTDFELAAMNAIKIVLPSVVIKGCYFHYSKNVWKKAKQLDLTKDAISQRHVRLSALLPLLPRKFISYQGWCYIMEDCPDTDAIQTFNDYMVSQWLENDSFVDIWCVHGERHRTTNAVESWHKKLNSAVPKNANLYQLLNVLKEDADLQTVVVTQYKSNAPPAKRCAQTTIMKNSWITYVTDQLLKNKISVGHCLEKLRV